MALPTLPMRGNDDSWTVALDGVPSHKSPSLYLDSDGITPQKLTAQGGVLFLNDVSLSGLNISVETLGAVGNGTTDDTAAVQAALTLASTYGLTVVLTTGKTYKITAPLYMWGRANLRSWSTPATGFGSFRFSVSTEPYLFNIGISGVNLVQEPWSGTIKNCDFTMVAGSGQHRIIFFWRTDGGRIEGCTGETGVLFYSFTSAGNDNAVLSGIPNYVRRNITIINNVWRATGSDNIGSEGIGLAWFDGARIQGNRIFGVGDDPIAVHFCDNVVIEDNIVTSVDGRIFISNCREVVVRNNEATRVIGGTDAIWHNGIALIYVGHESTATNSNYAPEGIQIHNNVLVYPSGSIDTGAAININGARRVDVKGNTFVNQSSGVTAKAFLLAPFSFVGTWTDPTGLDTTPAKNRDITVLGNVSAGAFPLGYSMSGTATDSPGPIVVAHNIGKGFGFQASTSYYLCDNRTGILQDVPYSTSITIDATQGPFRIVVTDNVAFAMNAPTSNIAGSYFQLGTQITINIKNTSGGAMGAITWNSVFKLAGAFTNPANGNSRSITFTNMSTLGVANLWIETSRNAADVPN